MIYREQSEARLYRPLARRVASTAGLLTGGSTSSSAPATGSSHQHVPAAALQHAPAAASQYTSPSAALSLLRSITDVRAIGEDDRHLVPGVDAWLGGRLPRDQFTRAVDSADEHGTTLLMLAACFAKVHVVRRLLYYGASVEMTNNSGRCALCYACLGPPLPARSGGVLEALLRAGARGGLERALEISALLGRTRNVRRLIAVGALHKGQLVSILPHAGHRPSTAPAPAVPPAPQAMAVVEQFSQRRGVYVCRVLAARPGPARSSDSGGGSGEGGGSERTSSTGCFAPADGDVAVPPELLHVPLHHLTSEHTMPVLAAGPTPLDLVAGALAGAPTALPAESAFHEDADGDAPGRLADGCAVRVVGRPEQWLRGRGGRVLGWDGNVQRYVVVLFAAAEEAEAAGDGEEDVVVQLMLRREHLCVR